MSDLISRQAAIDVLDKIFPADPMRNDYTQGITCGAALATEYIKQLPSAEQWTPVSKGLPKDLEVVNITYINTEPTTYYDHIKGKPMVATAVYYRKRFYWYSVACVDVLGEYGTNEWDEMDDRIEVKAWAPLPEPYKGGEA